MLTVEGHGYVLCNPNGTEASRGGLGSQAPMQEGQYFGCACAVVTWVCRHKSDLRQVGKHCRMG